MPETTPLIKAALNLRVGAGFDVYDYFVLEITFLSNGQKKTSKSVVDLEALFQPFLKI